MQEIIIVNDKFLNDLSSFLHSYFWLGFFIGIVFVLIIQIIYIIIKIYDTK